MSVELECPEYSGNRLDPKIRNYLAKVSHLWRTEERHRIYRYITWRVFCSKRL